VELERTWVVEFERGFFFDRVPDSHFDLTQ
jgi:hypothetical protein